MFVKKTLAVSVLVSTFSASIWADEPQVRHGVIQNQKPGIEVQAGSTFTFQTSNDSRLDDEGLLSVDLTAEVPVGRGKLLTYVEGNISPGQDGISSLAEEVNGDAGSALDGEGKGRLQVSEIHYTRRIGKNIFTVGIIDPDCRLDNSEIANDETSQFLGNAFINNPTIAFPDYTLGGCIHIHQDLAPYGLNVLVTSSHGLGDNPGRSYSELFDVGENGKGVFTGIELYRQTAYGIWRAGVWQNTADNEYVDGSGKVDDNSGIYLGGDYIRGDYGVNLRLGIANEEVSDAASFASLAFERYLGKTTLGVAAAYTGVSGEADNTKDDISQSEVYYRFGINDSVSITPSVQWVKNSGFDPSDRTVKSNLIVYGIRISMIFK
ncbi:MAG: carbohydrate porin [Thiohalophilus sp.]|uniref:carbohydrate porin n=1 Tax=Thiohalophilus sp. TaxID=3028392 RepID=UPI00286FAFF0|nr:carbohydrate porin [Thiohalophilus sp.]MDR9436719.1 carbohydrate porin [Thiohalophilus sp.]